MGTTATNKGEDSTSHPLEPAIAGNRYNLDRFSAARMACRGTLMAIALATSPAHAEFEPAITAGITHTDNVFLESADEDNELIYRLEPSFHFDHEAGALTLNADYRAQALRYRDIGESEVYHQYDVNLRAALIPDTFFLEVGGNRNQTIVDPELAIPYSNLPISANRQDRDEYYAAPSFQYAFGNDVAVTGSYRQTWLEYSDTDAAQSSPFAARDNRQGDASFALNNYQRERGLSWALRYLWQRSEYEEEIPWEYQKAMAELGFWIGANTRIFGAAGKESAWDDPLDPKMEDDVWEAGFSQQVGERLSAEFAAGERSFGGSWRGNLDFRFKRGSTTLSYAETPTTEGQNRFRRGAFDGPEVPEDFLSRPGSTNRYIAKRLEWTLNVELRRTGLTLSLFDAERAERTTAEGTPLGDESQRGANLVISYKLGPRTDLRLGGSWAERELEDGASGEILRGTFGADYRLGQRTSLALTYDYAEEDGESAFSIRDYVANTVSLDITRTF
ncbi:MAG TPA: TIGR03016 family PEP-CTERM system-associated outer membrane protein [Woeseiaceae bacterium]|nr:TIGR03016 family PEP-CTERM system-associated outer membrane protein [Woeseiaceae bacterium]